MPEALKQCTIIYGIISASYYYSPNKTEEKDPTQTPKELHNTINYIYLIDLPSLQADLPSYYI